MEPDIARCVECQRPVSHPDDDLCRACGAQAELTVEAPHEIRPDDDPMPGDRCKTCGKPITWVGPSTSTDWEHA